MAGEADGAAGTGQQGHSTRGAGGSRRAAAGRTADGDRTGRDTAEGQASMDAKFFIVLIIKCDGGGGQ